MCVCGRVIVPFAAAKFSVHPKIQLHGHRPSFHTTVSPTPPQSPLSLCFSHSLWTRLPVLLHTPLPPPYPSSHSYCLSGSHGPPTKAVGVGQWNNSWHPYGLHFPDHSVVPVLLFVSSCVMEQEKEQRRGKTNRVGERNGNGYEKLWSGKAVRRAPFLFFFIF